MPRSQNPWPPSSDWMADAALSRLWHFGCTLWDGWQVIMRNSLKTLLKFRPIRRFWHLMERVPPFMAAAFSPKGLVSASGRQLIWGKFRRGFFSAVPPFARWLQAKYGLKAGCSGCGASCRLLFQCPHWNAETRLCSVYEDRPSICRLFPITPSDIRDRDLVQDKQECGFVFTRAKSTESASSQRELLAPKRH